MKKKGVLYKKNSDEIKKGVVGILTCDVLSLLVIEFIM
jgi:hypothetical protein